MSFTNQRLARNRSGFSLIEILIVVAIIGLLATVVIANFQGIFGGAEEDITRTKIAGFETPLLKYRIDTGSYPTTQEGLNALISAPANKGSRWKGPYLKDGEQPTDAWGNPFHYRYPGTRNTGSYDLWSLGPDGTESADDIGNWEN